MMWVPDQQLRAVRGSSVTLRCVVESHPEALTFWHHAGRIVQPRGKFFMSTVQGKPSYKVKGNEKEGTAAVLLMIGLVNLDGFHTGHTGRNDNDTIDKRTSILQAYHWCRKA